MRYCILLVMLFQLGCGIPPSFKNAIILRYSTPNLSVAGVRHDGYYVRAEKVDPRSYKYQPKSVFIPDSSYWGFILYPDNTVCYFHFGTGKPYGSSAISPTGWGIYTTSDTGVKVQIIDPSWNGGGTAENNYRWSGNSLSSDRYVYFKSAGFGRYKRGEKVYPQPEVYRFVPCSILPPPDNWLKREKWMNY